MRNHLIRLRKIDWLRSNPNWKGRTIRENGKVLTGEDAVLLTCSEIKKRIGLPLNKEEEQKEILRVEN
jgi:DNA sulfur modification protein DndB